MFKTLKQHIFRSPYQSLAAILVVSLSLFLICVFFLLGAGSHKVLNYFESRPQVIAFLKDEAKPQEIELLKAKIEATGKVKKVTFVSKEDALKIYRQLFKDNPLLLEMVTAKILPASLDIQPNNLSSLKETALLVKDEPIVESVDYEEDVVLRLASFTSFLRNTGLIIAAFLLLVAVLTVLVILGMRISQRKDDIDILKLLGASGFYICLPLYLEGIIYGVLAAIIAWGLSYLLLLYLTPFLVKFLADVSLLPVPFLFMLTVLGGLVLLGILVGFLGSFFAVSRFMRAKK